MGELGLVHYRPLEAAVGEPEQPEAVAGEEIPRLVGHWKSPED